MKIVATLTSQFGAKSGYTGRSVSRVETYAIDSALDTDADQFSLDIGDTKSELVELLKRDNEVRVSISAILPNKKIVPLLKGYADTIGLTQDGTLSLAGRDLSSAAIDDTAIPYNWHNARPKQIIMGQAKQRGFSRFNIVPITPITTLFTDGSESVWALWYRMVRLRQMWIWVDSNGTLNIDHLNYGSRITYYFGTAPNKNPSQQWIPINTAQAQKNIQGRVGQVWVFGDTGIKSFDPIKVVDNKISQWIKKPLNIVVGDSAITSRAKAIKQANEVIFEGTVGELEYTIEITDPGYVIQQNKVAFLNLPTMGISGEFFIVGVRMLGGNQGLVQQIRLREKKYALTQRMPSSPQLKDTTTNISPSGLGSQLGVRWGEFFVVAAKAWHGGWDFNLFLAALLAICQKESTFRNVRQNADIEYYPNPYHNVNPNYPGFGGTEKGAVLQWKKDFANNQNNPLNPFYPRAEIGVGPMQLTDVGAKRIADERFGVFDEYSGGRWDAASNIWAGAAWLVHKAQGLPQTEANLWFAIRAYNGSGQAAEAYLRVVRQSIVSTYQPQIKTLVKQTQSLPANSTKTDKQLDNNTPMEIRRIVNFAERQEGKAYRHATQGPDTYDCSGLVWAAYNAAGLSDAIGGRSSTTGWWNSGRGVPGAVNSGATSLFFVPKDQLKIGDMVFFDNYTSDEQPAHMGLFYGDGQMIVATHTGSTIQVQSISESGLTFMGGMRLAGIWPIGNTESPIHGG